MHRSALAFALILLVGGAPLSAQQLEPNGPNGACTTNGIGPQGPNNPATIGATSAINVLVSGLPGQLFSLYLGRLATNSLLLPGGQFIDFDLQAPFTTVVDGIGFRLTAAGLPPVFGTTSPTGSTAFGFPAVPSAIGFAGAFQAAVIDPTNPIGVDLTGAPSFTIVPFDASATGDDFLFQYRLPFAVSLYGVVTNDIAVCTNGYVLLAPNGARGTFGSLAETTSTFASGAIGGAAAGSGPAIAAYWDDLDVGNTPNQSVRTSMDASGVLAVTWINADFFPNIPAGTFGIRLDSSASALTFDFSVFTANAPSGLVGVSSGGLPTTAIVQRELAVNGAVAPYAGTASETIFQNFNVGEPFAGVMDLAGLTLTFVDTGVGQWVIF